MERAEAAASPTILTLGSRFAVPSGVAVDGAIGVTNVIQVERETGARRGLAPVQILSYAL